MNLDVVWNLKTDCGVCVCVCVCVCVWCVCVCVKLLYLQLKKGYLTK